MGPVSRSSKQFCTIFEEVAARMLTKAIDIIFFDLHVNLESRLPIVSNGVQNFDSIDSLSA